MPRRQTSSQRKTGRALRPAVDFPPARLSLSGRAPCGIAGQIEAIEVHHLSPGGDEVLHEFLLGVAASVNFGESTKLGVRAEDQVGAGGGPFHLTGLPIASLENAFAPVDALPLRAHVEQVD